MLIFFNLSSSLYTKLDELTLHINTWKHNLRDLQGIVTTCYEWERFDGDDFVSCDLPNESGMYRMYNLIYACGIIKT